MPLDDVNDIRTLPAAGVPRAKIARRLRLSRNTVAKYADMADMSPAAPEARKRRRRALSPEDAAWIDAVLQADLGAPRKQRHSARHIYDRLVAERGYGGGSYSTVQRRVREWRAARRAGGGEGYLELEWAPGTAQVDFGNFGADVAGERLALKLLVVSLPHSNTRYTRACMSQRSECMCESPLRIFGRVGRALAALVLDKATEAGRMARGEVTEYPGCSPCSEPTTGARAATAARTPATRRAPWRTPSDSSGETCSSPCHRSARSKSSTGCSKPVARDSTPRRGAASGARSRRRSPRTSRR